MEAPPVETISGGLAVNSADYELIRLIRQSGLFAYPLDWFISWLRDRVQPQESIALPQFLFWETRSQVIWYAY